MVKPINCKYCGKEFKSKKRNRKQQFCSQSCAGKSKTKTTFKKGMTPWNKGIKYIQVTGDRSPTKRPEVKEKIKKGLKKHFDEVGRKSTINKLMRKSQAFMDWRRKVFERDDYTCQNCGIRSSIGCRVELHPHHIKHLAKFPELAYELNNGETLCKECHQKKHKKIHLTGEKAVKQ